LDFEIKRGVIINALRMIDFDNLLRNKLNKKIKNNPKEKTKRHSTSNSGSSNDNESLDSNELPKIESSESITQTKKKKEEKKERRNNYSGQYSISTLMDKNKTLSKDLKGIVLYSKLKGPHNLNTYSINNQTKKKKGTKETKTKKRIIDNHVSNSLASEVYLGKPLPKLRKNKKLNNSNTTKKNVKSSDKKENNENDNENKETNEISDNEKENGNNKENEELNKSNEKNNVSINENEEQAIENNDNEEKKETDIFKDHDFMYILKNKKKFTIDEVLKLQNMYENENKGSYYRAYPCDDEELMKKYKCYTQITSKNLNTNTLTTKIRLEYLKKKKEKEEEEERKRILWKKKVKQGYFIGRYKINKKDEKDLYERFRGSLYNKANNTRKTKSSDSSSSSTSYTSITSIKNISFEPNYETYDRLDNSNNSIISMKRNLDTISTLPSNQTLNRNLIENPLNNSNKLFTINYPFDITNSSFNNFKENNNSYKNKLLFINGKQINFESSNDDDDNAYFKYVLMNEKISKDNYSLRCQSAPSLRKEQSLSGLKTYDIVFENYN